MDSIPDDRVFTEDHPLRAFCGLREAHAAHKDRHVRTNWDGSKTGEWHECQGWETTHVVIVLKVDGNTGHTILEQPVDLRRYSLSSPMADKDNDELTIILEAREQGRELTEDEYLGRIAAGYVAPDVCPFDSDGCHEHLFDLRAEEER